MSLPQESDWILLPPSGRLAIARRPLSEIPPGARIATACELLAANRGYPFPWGTLPEPHPQNRHWKEGRIGVGGLIHTQWFVTSEGRYGGAPNVPTTTPGSLRCCMYLDGGGCVDDLPADNEGYAVVRPSTGEDQDMYRRVQLYACRHVMADGGAIICSPVLDNRKVMVGFVGRCQICPNLELISFPQLQATLPEYSFELWPEWKHWSLNRPAARAKPSLEMAA